MKNVIMLVIDSFCNDIIGKSQYGESATPFLDEIKEKCLYTENLYSQGPYTEAGLKGLLCGQNVMDEGGYMYRFNNISSFIFDPFYSKGYEIYNAYYPGQLYGKKISDKIDHSIYTQGFDYRGYWTFRIQYYIDIYNNRGLSQSEIDELINMYTILFSCMSDFYKEKVTTNDERYYFLKKRLEKYDMNSASEIIESEKKSFEKNPENYVIRVLQEGKEHVLYNMEAVSFTEPVDGESKEKIWKEERRFWHKCARKSFMLNVKNNFPNIGTLVQSIKTEDKFYFHNWMYRLNSARDYSKFLTGKEEIPIPSMGKQVEFMLERLKEHDTSRKPFLYMMHVEEAHYFNTFLSYDLNNYELLKEETKLLKQDFNKINSNYRGYLQYRQSMVYTDFWIKRMFERLNEMNLLEDTVVVITADHGSSYCYEPLRNERLVTNAHTSNYHIPLFIYDSSREGQNIKGYYNSKDVIPTLLDICEIQNEYGFKGKSMLDVKNEPTICDSEYLGTGCPDIRLRPIQFVARNEKYMISYEVRAGEKFERGLLREIYDLQLDRDEIKNLVGIVKESEVADLLDFLRKRHLEIYKEYKNIQSK